MKMKLVIAAVLTGSLLLSLPVCAADSKTAADTQSSSSDDDDDGDDAATTGVDALIQALGGGVTSAQLDAQVESGVYAGRTDALFHANITRPADVPAGGAWQSVAAERELIVGNARVTITDDMKPHTIDAALRAASVSHAAAAGRSLINRGSVRLQSFFSRYLTANIAYPFLIDGGRYEYRAGDAFCLYNYATGEWVEFPAAGFRRGHYDLQVLQGTLAGIDMTQFFNSRGEMSYTIERSNMTAQ